MYPEPHFSAAEYIRTQTEVQEQGFLADPLLETPDAPVLGLNLALHWPLPQVFSQEYERLRVGLERLDPGVYVYPFEETHVTLATLVNFKRHIQPTVDEVRRIHDLLPSLPAKLERFLTGIRPFSIDVGAPILVPAAAFLPILNPTGEIALIRKGVSEELTGAAAELALFQVPQAVHSTVLRFRRPPAASAAFAAAFRALAETVTFGKVPVDTILLTTETKCYMRAGAVIHRALLRSAPP